MVIYQLLKQVTPLTLKSTPNILEQEDDLEKLFEELEKEFAAQTNKGIENSNNLTNELANDKKISKLADDDFDFDFDFLDEKESVSDYLNIKTESETKVSDKKEAFKDANSEVDDFDFLNDFFNDDKVEISTNKETKSESNTKKRNEDEDFDFLNLDSIFEDLLDKEEGNKKSEIKEQERTFNTSQDDESENWLEKFRKASENVSEPKVQPKKVDEFDISSFFNNKNTTNSISSQKPSNSHVESGNDNDFSLSRENKKKDYYYISSLSGPKEIAQTIDKVSRKFDLDYAFTLNAGLSLHKDISPFTLINVYINERDLEIFEDYLKLTPSSERDAHLCIMLAKDREIFEDSYELNGLFVVSNVQLRSDFIDKGMDNYAREV